MNRTYKAQTAEPLAALLAYVTTATGPLDVGLIETLAKRMRQIELELSDERAEEFDVAAKFAGHQSLTAADIAGLNRVMPWATSILFDGQLQGGVWNERKRSHVHLVPDPHLAELGEYLQGKRVLEVGCHEGYYSLGMAVYARHVVAVDGRVENVVKTLVRAWMAGALDRIAPVCHDFEAEIVPAFAAPDAKGLCFDLIHHNGLLYHLSDPLVHLARLLASNPAEMLFLDTHVADGRQLNARYRFEGKTYDAYAYREPVERGFSPFAGMTPVAVWLKQEDLIEFLAERGFKRVLKNRLEQQRNGTRCSMLVSR